MSGRVLVTGAGGQLGVDTVRAFEGAGWDVTGLNRAQLDVGDESSVSAAVVGLRPTVIVNCAAFTAVDECETQVSHAQRDNALAVRWLRQAAETVGARLIHISTDYVFDGTKADPYVETDPTNPISVYGQTKLAGETEAGPDATVVRTSWVCGAHGNNMVKTVLRLAADPSLPLAFVDDQRGCPTFTADLAGLLVSLAADPVPGVVHATNQGAVSWYEFVGEILGLAGLDPSRVQPIATADLHPPRPAPRPANSVLDNAVLRGLGRRLLPHHRDGLARLLAELGVG